MKLKLIAATVAALTLAGTAVAGVRHYTVPTGVHVVLAKHGVRATVEHGRAGNRVVGGSFLAAASTYLQVDRATILAGLEAGQSLAQIATAHGKTADGLVAALLAPAKLKLDAAVAAGKLAADREATILSKLQTAVTKLVNRTLPARSTTPKTHAVHVSPTAILQPALSYLKLDLKAVVAQLRTGKTLAQIAVAQGGTAQGLIDAVVASVKTKLDAQVAAGHITAAQETSYLATLQTSVAKFVNG